MKAVIVAAVVFCLGLIGIGWYLGTREDTGGPRLIKMSQDYLDREQRGGWVKGNISDPKVKVIEYADFQCPACGAVYSVVNEAMDATKDYTQYTFKEYPLPQIHNKADAAAIAAEAAGRQGKFWQMHELLYARQADWAEDSVIGFNSTLMDYAKNIQLDAEQFKRDLKDTTIQDQIDKDTNAGNIAQIQGTPSIFVNGTLLESIPRTKEEFIAVLAEAKKQAESTSSESATPTPTN